MTLLLTYVAIALVVSFLCSILEATLLTLSPAAIAAARESGKRWADRMEALKADIDRPLSAILTLNTIAHTMGAAGAGAEYARVYGAGGEAVFAGLLTLAILVFTEIVPKTFGAYYAQSLAAPASILLPILIKALAPLVWLSRLITRAITPKDGIKPMHREELMAVARLGEESGQIGERESQFVQNLLQLNGMRAWDIMTPRPVIFALPASTPLLDFVQRYEDKPFTRIPVYRNSRDEIAGFVLRSEVLIAHLKDAEDALTLETVMRPIAV